MMQCHSLSVLERQRAQLQWQQHTQDCNNFFMDNLFSFHGECLGDGWPNIATNNDVIAAAAATCTTTASDSTSSFKISQENSSSKKGKTGMHSAVTGNEDEGNTTEDSRESSSKDKNNNNGKNKKPDYVHVRARRGQATNSHSLAERLRREKISERMKYLQSLVPGCDRITGKAGMLDEIINYVQSLQKQVEFLSMKLATVKPRLDLNMDALLSKEMKFSGNHSMSAIDPPLMLNLNQLQQAIAMPEQSVHRISASPDNKLDSFYNASLELYQGRVFPPYPVLGKVISTAVWLLDLETVGCFFEHHEMGFSPRKIMYLDVDLQLSRSTAQSASA